ncbi:MAG: branched-chain amino acid transport system substrate-binding protein [Patescibacteria group bacterium]|nr:branched-chain amino acid transport system substrate-binding protein [Patescibacteria group bacterium]
MNKSYIWKVAVTAGIILLFIGGYSSISKNSVSGEYGNTAGHTAKIGVSLPLTGKSASIGERVKNAITLAQEEINSSSNGSTYKIDLIFQDDQGESTPTVNTIQKLIQTDKVKIILGLIKSDPLLAIAPITEKEKVIVMSPTAGADAISTAGDYIFRTIETAIMHGKKSASLFRELQIHKVAVLTANASNAQTYSKHFKEQFALSDGQIVEDTSYPSEQTDFKTDIAKAIKSNAGGIFIGVGTAKEAGLIVKQSRELGFKGVIVASVAADAQEFFNTAGTSAKGTYVIASPFNTKSNLEAKKFGEQYYAKYGTHPDGFAANGYDALKLLSKAVDICEGTSDTACIRDYLYSIKGYEGVGGTISFNSNGDVVKEPQVKIAENEAFKVWK